MDANNAFLKGTLHDKVFMMQPSGFVDNDKSDYVCKLEKAIYGLCQAPRAWYVELSSFLIVCSFTNATSDASLFVFNKKKVLMYFL